MFTDRDLKKLILPLIVEQFLAMAIGMVDTVMVSSVGEAAVSGISLVDSINFLLIMLFSSFATGGAVIAAQYLGKGEKWNANIVAKQLEIFSLLASLVIGAVAIIFRDFALSSIFGQIEPDVMENARTYFFISALSYPFLGVYNAGAALFRAMGDSRTSMYISIMMNAVNVGGNAIGIYALNQGVAGAAVATLISRILGAVIITILLVNPDRDIHIDRIWKFEIKPKVLRQILRIGVPNGLENSIFQIGKILTMSVVSGLGTASITANAVTGNLAGIQIIPGSAIGMALITVVGQAVGAKDFAEAKRLTKKLLKITYFSTWIMTGLLLLLYPLITQAYSLSAETSEILFTLFLIHAVSAVVIWPLAFSLPNALRAASDATFTMTVSLISMWVFRIACSYLFIYVFDMGVSGIWYAMIIDWLCRSILFLWRFKSEKWQSKSFL